MIQVGIDEAGLGPTLGPLVIAASVWEYEDGANPWDFSLLLDPVRGLIADSKQIFNPSQGLSRLEYAAVRVLQASCGVLPSTFSHLVHSLTGKNVAAVFEHSPWFTGQELPLPVACSIEDIPGVALENSPVRNVISLTRILNVPAFNGRVRMGMNKAELQFAEVGDLIREIMDTYSDQDITITVDRLGGRKFYLQYLREQFPGWRVRKEMESDAESVYELHRNDTVIAISFKVKADAEHFCVACASLVAKYLRELSMHIFNDYFQEMAVDLKPTQGYPSDARRFLKSIDPLIDQDTRMHLVRVR